MGSLGIDVLCVNKTCPSLRVGTVPRSLTLWVSNVFLFVGGPSVTDGFNRTSLCEPSGGALVAIFRTRTGGLGQE